MPKQDKNEQQVLVIVYHFPPLGGGAVMRTFNYVKYLPEQNWQPIVLTANKDEYNSFAPLDSKLLNQIPKVSIQRIDSLAKPPLTSTVEREHNKFSLASLIRILEKKIRNKVRALLYRIMVPDGHILWAIPAYCAAKKLAGQQNIDLIYTTSPPHSIHIAGILLKKAMGKPWIADFRDIWADSSNPSWSSQGKTKRLIAKLIEKKIMKSADIVISATDPATRNLHARFPDISRDKFVTITNGFDGETYEEVRQRVGKTRTERAAFTISYIGSLGPPFTPVFFLRGIESAINQSPELQKHLKLNFIGWIRGYREMLNNFQPSAANIREHLPYQEAVEEMLRSDVLLLLHSPIFGIEARTTIPGKLFEYIGAAKPILGLLPEGAAADFIRKHKIGVVVPHDDIEEISKAVLELFRLWQEDKLDTFQDSKLMKQFDRVELARNLANICNAITAHS